MANVRGTLGFLQYASMRSFSDIAATFNQAKLVQGYLQYMPQESSITHHLP